jgi:predicted DNA-binding protein (UPF0251 family)
MIYDPNIELPIRFRTSFEQFEPKFTGKVTQILLELDETEVLHLIDSANDLREKVSQVLEALRRRDANNTCDDANHTSTPSSLSSSNHIADISSDHRP